MVFLRGKVVVVGDCCVGKSAICQVLSSDGGSYPKSYNSVSCLSIFKIKIKFLYKTLMTELLIKQIQLTDTDDTVELFLHDNSGKAIYFENCKETVD